MERFDGLGFLAPGPPVHVQQVLERLSLYGLLGHAPENEACHHHAVRASQGRCIWVIGEVEAVAFGQLRWSVCFSHAAFNVTRCLPPDQTLIHRSAWKGNSAKLNFRFHHFSEVRPQKLGIF
jgi:hypothetical protein